MASIIKLKNGKWRAQVRRKGFKDITKQCDTKSAATAWAAQIEADMKSGVTPESRKQTIAQLIEQYRKLRGVNRPVKPKSTEDYTLNILVDTLGEIRVADFSADTVTGWAQERMDSGVGGYKINCDLSKLGTVLRYVLPSALPILETARPKLEYLGLIAGAGSRERRPTEEELQLILAWLAQNEGQAARDFVEFATLTAMRRAEVSGLRWVDLNLQDKTILVRDRKDPRQKIGNDQVVPLLAGSFEIVLRQKREGEQIFPLRPKHVTKIFHDACVALKIEGLHFHDLRHHGISLMFEHGYDIHQVSIVSGHKNWSHLKRYTQIKPHSLHDLDTRQGKLQRHDSQQSASTPPGTS